jgi:hypothetical protein
MRVFGTKQIEPTDADRAAAARLSAVAARFKREPTSDFTEVEHDPLGEPEETSEEFADEIGTSAEPEQPEDSEEEPDSDE